MDSVLISHVRDRDPQRGAGSDDRPAIRELESVLFAAIEAGASDVHIEPADGSGVVRHRVDGILYRVGILPGNLLAHVISRVKVLAGMDIADKRQPQDGRYSICYGRREIDARVSSMPTTAGEKIVIRLLDRGARVRAVEQLGVPGRLQPVFEAIVRSPHGFVLITGPTGSGKTTTAYAALTQRDAVRENLCSVEDPVELTFPGVTQVQVNPKAGLTFASAARALLRQDPNVILIGEMRDADTAAVASRAAMSGQLVLTTLHSNDAVTALDRLAALGVPPQSIASALTAIIAQRLVRKLCVLCRRPSDEHSAIPGLNLERGALVYQAQGCAACGGTGYNARIALFECLVLDDTLRTLIAAGSGSLAVGRAAATSGFLPLRTAALEALVAGQTSPDELQRVLGTL